MKRTLLIGLACHALALGAMSDRVRSRNEYEYASPFLDNDAVDTQGPYKTPHAKRPKKGKGQRKANRSGRWG